jgi:hypothetical protein
MTDITSKLLLAAVALGLWANLLLPILHPIPAFAQSYDFSNIERHVRQIANGTCTNSKIC